MGKSESSLDRLSKLSQISDDLFGDEEDSISTDDYLDDVSDEMKNSFGSLIQEVTIDEEENTDDKPVEKVESSSDDISVKSTVEEPKNVEEGPTEEIKIDVEDTGVDMTLEESISSTKTKEVLFNNNKPKRTRGRPKSKVENTIETESISDSNMVEDLSSIDLVLNQLSKDIIDELRKIRFKIGRFDDKSMEVIFNYMVKKF